MASIHCSLFFSCLRNKENYFEKHYLVCLNKSKLIPVHVIKQELHAFVNFRRSYEKMTNNLGISKKERNPTLKISHF